MASFFLWTLLFGRPRAGFFSLEIRVLATLIRWIRAPADPLKESLEEPLSILKGTPIDPVFQEPLKKTFMDPFEGLP